MVTLYHHLGFDWTPFGGMRVNVLHLADVVLSENRISKLIVWQCSLTFVVIFLP